MALPMPMPTAPARQTPRVRTPMFLLGVGLALLAFILMFTFGILFANTAQTGRKVPVVVAAADIQAREPITIATLTLAEIPQTALPPHAFVRPTDLLCVPQDVSPRNAPASTLFYSLWDGFGNIVRLDEASGSLSILGPTQLRNDAIATANSDLFFNKPSRLLTRTVYTNVRVIRVGPPTLGPKQGQTVGVVASLTVVLSQCDAQFLEWLLTNVTLKYVLLDYHSYDPTALGKPDPTCPSNSTPSAVGPKEVDERWSFTKG